MCFSAEASFTAAAVLGAIGAAGLAQRPGPAHLAFAAFPLIFAAQQAIEGLIWHSLYAGADPPRGLVLAYLFIAKALWSALTPFAVLMMESDLGRRRALLALFALGLLVSFTLASSLLQHDGAVRVYGHSLHYLDEAPFGNVLIACYALAVIAPMLISRHPFVKAFGAAVFIGGVATALAFYYAAASVWCFFAALSSALVFLHVRRQARLADGGFGPGAAVGAE